MKVLVSGGQGQLGRALERASHDLPVRLILTDRTELNVEREEDWMRALSAYRPDAVIHAAAYTAVDLAECNAEEAFRLNRDAARIAASVCAKKTRFIAISTDYVFDGMKGEAYTEEDDCAPLSVYGASKREGEVAMLEANPEALIVRVAWLYSTYGKNFMNSMLQRFAEGQAVRVVDDQISSPTCAITFARHLLQVILMDDEKRAKGIVHYSLEGTASWYDLAQAIHQRTGAQSPIEAISTEAYQTPAKRPRFSKLSNEKFKSITGIELPHWQEALNDCLK